MTPVQIDLWALITFLVFLAVTVVGGIVGAARYTLTQSERRQDERHEAGEKARMERARHWDARFTALEAAAKADAGQWQRVERELLSLKADLPVLYVRREDYVRNQTIIEAKLDAVALKLENIQLKGIKS
ncbi:MAG: hypothetical protein KJZ96_15580 [Rhodocyclaceae bacterium]|nr:hypothetical protein [Rhodocyclaceae bacterium]